MQNDFVDFTSFKLNFSLDINENIANFLVVDLPNNKKGLLLVKYIVSSDFDKFGKESSYITFSTPILNFDGTVYNKDFFKLGRYLKDTRPVVTIIRDNTSLYLSLSYCKMKVDEYLKKYVVDHNNIINILYKHRFPDFMLEWKNEFLNRSIQSMTTNDKELAIFDMRECEVLFLNKFDGKYNNKKINLSMNGKLELQNMVVRNPDFNISSHHDITFVGNNLVAASHSNDVIMLDENLEVIYSLDVQKNSIVESIANGGKITSLQSNIEDNHIYFASDNKLMVITNDGIKKIKEFENKIWKLFFNNKDRSLLVYTANEKRNIEVELIPVYFINELINKNNSYLESKILLPKMK